MSAERCSHERLHLGVSSYAATAGYERPSSEERVVAATTNSGRKPATCSSKVMIAPSQNVFPAPLVLPSDDLALDPEYPPQSMQEWLKDKNSTPKRKIIYVAAPPKISSEVAYLHDWIISKGANEVNHPKIQGVLDCLAAFYHGFQVKLLPAVLQFAAWESDVDSETKSKPRKSRKQDQSPNHIGLQTSSEIIQIRARHNAASIFAHQLNLDDLLDVAISILPSDAYALLLLVHHDICENDDDEFACGRAYGGSHVAVVSMARYNPELDEQQGVDREHTWPASHCSTYIEACCNSVRGGKRRKISKNAMAENSVEDSTTTSPIQAAIAAHSHHLRQPKPSALDTLFLERVCRTASHELGHCFGIDHYVYYACVMQGTASLAEDARQPLYLCPVDLAKVLAVTGVEEKARYEALLRFCEKEEGAGFKAYGAWLKGVLAGT